MKTRPKIRVLPRAVLDVAEQASHYREVASPELAARWRRAANQSISSLLTFPERGAVLRIKNAAGERARFLRVGGFPNHLILYRWLAEKNTVLITNVLHGARDLETIFGHIGPE